MTQINGFNADSIGEKMDLSRSRVFGATFMIAGTSIGGGMLGLPIMAGLGGFGPSIVISFVCWLVMVLTGLLVLELFFALKGEINFVSMAAHCLGKWGKVSCWVVYLFLFYSLTIAYVSGCGEVLFDLSNGSIPAGAGTLLFVVIFSPLVYLGARATDRVNRWLICGLVISFALFVLLGWHRVKTQNLTHMHWPAAFIAIPITLTSFGFQGTVPTIAVYLRHQKKQIAWAIIIGSFLPFVVYILWNFLVMGIVPIEGEHGLMAAFQSKVTAVSPLSSIIGSHVIAWAGEFFAFFAIVTSFLGVTLGLLDFLADGFAVSKTPIVKLWLCALIFVPPVILTFLDPRIFLVALNYGGGIGAIFLLCLFPVWMVWRLRYHHRIVSPFRVGGGKALLIVLLIVIVLEIGWQLKLLFSP